MRQYCGDGAFQIAIFLSFLNKNTLPWLICGETSFGELGRMQMNAVEPRMTQEVPKCRADLPGLWLTNLLIPPLKGKTCKA